MARVVPNRPYQRAPHIYERAPHIHGALPNQYRYGTAVGNAKNLLHWEPDVAHDAHYPYYADQYARDVREWVAATEFEEKRQGLMFIFALGGAARRSFDDLETSGRQCGVDQSDGQGCYCHFGAVQFILRVLEDKFPAYEEARLLRTGLDFFESTLRRDERPALWFQHFVSMLIEANPVAGFGLDVRFRSWLLLSLLPLSFPKWASPLKDLCHRLPVDMDEH